MEQAAVRGRPQRPGGVQAQGRYWSPGSPLGITFDDVFVVVICLLAFVLFLGSSARFGLVPPYPDFCNKSLAGTRLWYSGGVGE